jgi:hypothetical protein
MNDARSLYLSSYFRINCMDNLIKNTRKLVGVGVCFVCIQGGIACVAILSLLSSLTTRKCVKHICKKMGVIPCFPMYGLSHPYENISFSLYSTVVQVRDPGK